MLETDSIEISRQNSPQHHCREADRSIAHERRKIFLRPTKDKQRIDGMAHRNVCTVKETVYAAGRHVRRFERFHAGIESGDENYIAESTGNAEARALRNLIQGPAVGVGCGVVGDESVQC